MIGYGRQDVTPEDVEAVKEALLSDFLTTGPRVRDFEAAIASYCGAAGAVAGANATATLHMAYHAVGVGPGDLVWTAPNTFLSTANAALFLGADVDFVDVDSETYNLSVEALATKLEAAKAEGRLPKLVVPVHFSGQSCDMAAIAELAARYGFRVVEDAAHAIGGRYQGAPVGDCRYADAASFSFHPVKIITTGEGGVATANDPEILARMAQFRSHGMTRDPERMVSESDGPWYYQMVELGFNYRLTDIQAALGLSQMTRLDAYVARRHAIAARYDEAFADLDIVTPYRADWQYSGFHLYVVRWPQGVGGMGRRAAFQALRERGVGVNVHYIPVHLQPFYAAKGFKRGDFPVAEAYYDEAITLPLHPKLTDVEIDTVISAVRGLALGRAAA